ncbi:1-aminocyclopropane-1-carboxylate deaminase/D-cysteine desulfhydrase [Kangiella marina]|uniref:Pyridoxal-phosphate dependent enzyme n=1 Tax=Kangiella marina TaxID=1079178 RepID=A0ABP8IFM1_9GAMM
MIELNHSPTQVVKWSLAEQKSVNVDIKRDDLLHPVISGNKWRKLKYLISDAQEKGCSELISMGGNWSNHLHALAYVGKALNLRTRGFVRAHPNQAITPTLEDCQRWGMRLQFCSRQEYAALRQDNHWSRFSEQSPDSYWLSEGGFGQLAIRGVEDIAQEVDEHYDYIFVGCGSGATLCGLSKTFNHSHVVGVAAFSGADYLQESLGKHIGPRDSNWSLDTQHHCGGFAKRNADLDEVISSLELTNSFKLDPVYNGKTFLALQSWLALGKIPSGSKVLVIHTGGLQGTRSP